MDLRHPNQCACACLHFVALRIILTRFPLKLENLSVRNGRHESQDAIAETLIGNGCGGRLKKAPLQILQCPNANHSRRDQGNWEMHRHSLKN